MVTQSTEGFKERLVKIHPNERLPLKERKGTGIGM